MPGSSPPRDNLKEFLRKLNGFALPVAWWDEGRPMDPRGWIELTEISMIAQGVDEFRRTYDDITKEQGMIVAGVRKWTVQVKCYSYDPNLKPVDVIEKIKLRLGKPYAYQQYQQWGLSLQDWGTTLPVPNPVDDHVYPAATCDFIFGWRVTDLDLETESEGYINEATGDGTIEPGDKDVPFDIKGPT